LNGASHRYLYLYVCVTEVPECAGAVEEATSISEGVDYDEAEVAYSGFGRHGRRGKWECVQALQLDGVIPEPKTCDQACDPNWHA
jgi:hypothetical protein